MQGRRCWVSPSPSLRLQTTQQLTHSLATPTKSGSCSIVTYQAPFLPGWRWGSFPGQWGAREGGNQAEWCSPCHDLEKHKGEGVRPGREGPASAHTRVLHGKESAECRHVGAHLNEKVQVCPYMYLSLPKCPMISCVYAPLLCVALCVSLCACVFAFACVSL